MGVTNTPWTQRTHHGDFGVYVHEFCLNMSYNSNRMQMYNIVRLHM